MTRVHGAAIALLGALLGVLPFLTWYRADLVGRDVTMSGVDVSGELWVLPVLGGLAVAVGAALVALAPPPGGRAAWALGAVAAAAGALGVVWGLRGAVNPRAAAVAAGVADAPAVPLETEPLGYLAVATAAAVAAAAFLWLRQGADHGTRGRSR